MSTTSRTAVEGKLKKSLARFKERIENGSYYEAQQTIKSITNRYVHSKNFDAAIELLYQSSMILMEFKKFDETSDLILYMIEIFEIENKPLEEFKKQSLNKVIELITVFPDDDLNLVNLAKELNKFAIKKTGSEVGFVHLNQVLGEKLYYSGSAETVNLSEHYLLLSGTEESRKLLIDLNFGAFMNDQPSTFAYYTSRLVLPFIMLSNIKFATLSLNDMIERLKSSNRAADFPFKLCESILIIEAVSNDSELDDCYKLFNFLQLLLELVQRSSPEHPTNFKVLTNRYKRILEKHELLPKINAIGLMYFSVSIIQKQGNMLQDMMSGLLGGGSR
ncbi:hypothetical protein CANARDRAFT_5344 [[Candida] arabinofermentans NRRL YB-2248]|uniref:Uncharacterized protein n=1 Tax=[Candida] arabinofermentans NRRL YB-2248 TaxID=983967 RepID=A0A1E4T8H6_9ASCO|nr:hypothetical protein CANARDRAFT_5344 [[Candida] arabinofermentans NRRL YB-2248]